MRVLVEKNVGRGGRIEHGEKISCYEIRSKGVGKNFCFFPYLAKSGCLDDWFGGHYRVLSPPLADKCWVFSFKFFRRWFRRLRGNFGGRNCGNYLVKRCWCFVGKGYNLISRNEWGICNLLFGIKIVRFSDLAEIL